MMQQPEIEELRMIQDYVLYQPMLAMVQRATDEARYQGSILKELNVISGELLIRQLSKDQYKLRQELKRRGIRFIGDVNNDGFASHYRYVYKGYENDFGITREVVKAEIGIRLGKYVGQIKEKIRRLDII